MGFDACGEPTCPRFYSFDGSLVRTLNYDLSVLYKFFGNGFTECGALLGVFKSGRMWAHFVWRTEGMIGEWGIHDQGGDG